jgi:type I restriction enzyme S subunit
LKLGAVLRFRYDPTAVKFTKAPIREDAHYWLRPGDVLISRSNAPNLVGHAAIYDGTPHPCIYPDLLMRMRVDEKRAYPGFVIFWLRSSETRHYIGQRARGASSTMKKISQGDVREIPFPEVPLSEQRHIVDYLNGVQAQVAELKRLQSASAAELERLSGAVLARAFRGGL